MTTVDKNREGLLERRIDLIPPGDTEAIPAWVACRSLAPVEAALDRMVSVLNEGGSVARRLREVHSIRAEAREQLRAHATVLPLLDAATGSLLVHFVEMLRALVLASRRPRAEQLDLLECIGAHAVGLAPWDPAPRARAERLLSDIRARLLSAEGA